MKIKSSIIPILFIILFSMNVVAQSWQTVGTAGFSSDPIDEITIAIRDSTPYVAYRTSSPNFKLTVAKFNGSNWDTLGAPGLGSNISLFIADNDTPYVAFRDGNNKETVMKFDGNNWIPVGNVGFSSPLASVGGNKNLLALDSNGVPYVAFLADNGIGGSGDVKVMSFDGSSWNYLPSTGFFNNGIQNNELQFSIDTNNALFVSFGFDMNNTLYAYKFDGTSWIDLSSSLPSLNYIGSMAIDHANNIPILTTVAPFSSPYYGKISAWKYNGSSWDSVGNNHFNPLNAIGATSLAINNNGTPYVTDSNIVMKYDGINWMQVGNDMPTYYCSGIAIDYNNIPYVAFQDVLNGYKSTVMRFTNSTANIPKNNEQQLNIYPNPARSSFVLQTLGLSNDAEVIIYDVNGIVKLQERITDNRIEVGKGKFQSGTYLVKINDGKNYSCQKIIID